MKKQTKAVVATTTEGHAGRPSKFMPEFTERAHKMALLGLTDEAMADVLGVARSTFSLWKKNNPEFSDAVQGGKILADAKVAAALYIRAVGYEYPSEKLLTVSVGDGVSEVQRHPITVHVLPDPGAALNWLKNRQPKLWRDKQDVQLSGEISVTLNLDGDHSNNSKTE
ncbi:helix-turn-helix domain-containing protein [Rudanella paleaurantiibacter]|uniref:Helix-turn-helix domain-containing protein n=1 Tax=Rudanella paleaurantiibacter TaxID=2614655 RepID=A0A7J5U018_9BACT|nr:helix-turn-helix domain-containing protein [Rudanella paleaurantiibacter]KAB7731086.1 helix-turn-helix domain-containing protein [Rudanella paleaurantiibacter]